MLDAEILWMKNMNALEKQNPELHTQLSQLKPEKYQRVLLPNGEFDLITGNTRLYGDIPSVYAQSVIDASRRVHPKMVVLYGFGLGYTLRSLVEDFGKDTCHIIIVEQDIELIWQAFHCFDFSQEIGGIRLKWYVNSPLETLDSELRDYLLEQDRFMLHKTLIPIYEKVSLILSTDQNYYLKFAEKLQSAIEYHTKMMLLPPGEDSYLAFTNIIENLKSSLPVPSFHKMKGKFKDFPGILVSTGPSLEKHFDFLRSVNDRAVIVCADSALRTLVKNGIYPHFVGTLERVTETKYFFDGVEETPNTWLLLTPITWPETYSGYKGPKAHLMRLLAQIHYFWPETEPKYTGNSCAHVGLIALHDMGCSPILLLGQDFAFDRFSKKTHAGEQPSVIAKVEGKVRDQAQESVDLGDTQWLVEGNNGEKILTSHWLRDFQIKTEDLLNKMKVKCYNVIPQEYGAKIQHTIRIDPSEANSLLGEQRDVVNIIRSTLKPPTDDEQKEKNIFIHGQVLKAIDELNMLQSLSLDMLASFSSYFNQFCTDFYPPDFYTPYLRKIDEIMEKLLFDKSRDVFINFFGPQIQETYLTLTVLSHELLTDKLKPEEKLEKQKDYIFQMFKTIHYWSSRMHHFIITHQECWDPNFKSNSKEDLTEEENYAHE